MAGAGRPTLEDPRDRLIVALDVPDGARARALVEQLGDAVTFYKLGLELLLSGAYLDLVGELLDADKRVFLDLKFYDTPRTVAAAVAQAARLGATFLTVHGDAGMLEAACAAKGDLRVLAVTVLTSLDEHDLRDMGYDGDVASLVVSRARQAVAAGCDGVIASGREAAAIRAEIGDGALVVTPGVRPEGAPADDQKRTVTVAEALRAGADHLVVGRPIRAAADPRAAAAAIQAEIARAL